VTVASLLAVCFDAVAAANLADSEPGGGEIATPDATVTPEEAVVAAAGLVNTSERDKGCVDARLAGEEDITTTDCDRKDDDNAEVAARADVTSIATEGASVGEVVDMRSGGTAEGPSVGVEGALLRTELCPGTRKVADCGGSDFFLFDPKGIGLRTGYPTGESGCACVEPVEELAAGEDTKHIAEAL